MLVRLHAENFKTFKSSVVSLGPVSLVLGANGVGKSNFFDALRFLKYVGDGVPIRDALEGHVSTGPSASQVSGIRGGAKGIPHFGSETDQFELRVEIRSENDELTYAIRVDTSRYRVAQEELRSKRHPGPYVFSTRPHSGPGLDQDPDAPVIVARYYKNTRGPNPRREFSPNECILSQFVGRRAESRRNESVAERVRTELASIRPLELRPEVLRQYSPLGRFELGEHGENFAAVLWQLYRMADLDKRRVQRRLDIPGDEGDQESLPGFATDGTALSAGDRLEAINAWLAELMPTPIESVKFQRAPTNEVIFAVKERFSEELVNARSLSDGTLRFAALALAALGSPGRQTLVVEEIENGINPARIALLIRMLEQVTSSSEEVQVIASTHSPGILDYASEKTIKDSTVIGWHSESMASVPVRIGDLPDLERVRERATLGDLQAEGWLQYAADFKSEA